MFVERRDFEYYLENLQEWKQVYELEVFSYCLMTNHVHPVVQANDNLTAIPQLMKRLAGRQTRFVNALEKRSGSLWEGRYKISPVDTDAYLLACCRYVELNPVKAGMVDKPERYEGSSYPARLGMAPCNWLANGCPGFPGVMPACCVRNCKIRCLSIISCGHGENTFCKLPNGVSME